MIQTFQFRTETADNTYYHTVYSIDIKSAIDGWIIQIEDLQNQVYSFDSSQVQNIKQQYLNGLLKTQVEKEPFFLVFYVGDTHQHVNIDKVNKGEPDFIAKLNYLTTEQGGRKSYASSGYRPHVKFDGRKEMTSGEQLFIDKEKVLPGETVTAEIRILGKELFKNYLFVGQHFEFAEATRVIGHGEVLEVVNPDLRCRETYEGEIATYWFDDGILVSLSKAPKRTVENIKANVQLVKQITNNKPTPLLIYLSNSPVPDKAAREYSTQQLPVIYSAMAMVSKPGLAKFIMNILFALRKPPIPMKSFTDDKEAKNWLKQFL